MSDFTIFLIRFFGCINMAFWGLWSLFSGLYLLDKIANGRSVSSKDFGEWAIYFGLFAVGYLFVFKWRQPKPRNAFGEACDEVTKRVAASKDEKPPEQ